MVCSTCKKTVTFDIEHPDSEAIMTVFPMGALNAIVTYLLENMRDDLPPDAIEFGEKAKEESDPVKDLSIQQKTRVCKCPACGAINRFRNIPALHNDIPYPENESEYNF